MKIFNLIKKYSKIRFSVGIIIVGIIISAIAGTMFAAPDTGNYEKVNATITNIESRQNGDDTEYTVYVKYSVDGKEYQTELGAYQSNWDVGTDVECEYNVENPAELRTGDGKMMSLIICAVGIVAVIYGALTLVKGIKASTDDFAQYNRVKEIDEAKAQEIREKNEPKEEFVFHFTGKLNQSYIMKNKYGEAVYEAICDGVKLVKDTEYEFKNCITGESSTKMVSHTITGYYGNGSISTAVKSAFKIDGESCWDIIASMGYGFDFSLNGIKAHYEVKHEGVNIGYVEIGGTGLMDEKYKDNPLGKVPTNGIFKIECPKSDIEAMFLICFCLSRTEETLS